MGEVQVVVFTLEREEYGLEISKVQEIVHYQQATKIPEAPDFFQWIINLRGKVIPVFDLKKRFYQKETQITENTRIVVASVGSFTVGIMADEVSEVLQLPEETIETLPTIFASFAEGGVYAVGKLEDRLLLLLDLEKTINEKELENLEAGLL